MYSSHKTGLGIWIVFTILLVPATSLEEVIKLFISSPLKEMVYFIETFISESVLLIISVSIFVLTKPLYNSSSKFSDVILILSIPKADFCPVTKYTFLIIPLPEYHLELGYWFLTKTANTSFPSKFNSEVISK